MYDLDRGEGVERRTICNNARKTNKYLRKCPRFASTTLPLMIVVVVAVVVVVMVMVIVMVVK